MKNLLYNLDSIEVSYGDNVLNSIVQTNERINSITESLQNKDRFNGFEKTQIADRLQKIVELNHRIQKELEEQRQKLSDIKNNLEAEANSFNSRAFI